MAETTSIAWCDATFNPWRGCTKVSPGCAHCYAETLSKRNPKTLGVWGDQGTRVVAAESYWRQPLKWDREAREAGERRRVFCASLADVFEDREELSRPLARLLKTIHLTPHLDWLLLTKRPEVIDRRLERATNCRPLTQDEEDGAELASQWRIGSVMPNVWLGVSVEDQARADERIPQLLQTPAAVRFLSCEPLLGPVDLTRWLTPPLTDEGAEQLDWSPGLDWIIAGGESGPGARPCDTVWVRSLVNQCRDAGVPAFVKQLGASVRTVTFLGWPDGTTFDADGDTITTARLRDKKGGDPAEWPADLQVRQFPEAR